MMLNLQDIPDDQLQAEFRRREEIERRFAWSVTLMREFAIWESETGRSRKITEWHARQLAERLCTVLEISREAFANRIIAKSMLAVTDTGTTHAQTASELSG